MDLHVLFTAKRYNSRIPLSGKQRRALDTLSQMQVRGKVQVRMRYDFKEVKTSIETLQLESRMKA